MSHTTKTVAIKMYSPLLRSGMQAVVGAINGVKIVTDTNHADLLITDSADPVVAQLSAGERGDMPVIAVMTSLMPPELTAGLADRIDLYDAESVIAEKIERQLHNNEGEAESAGQTDALSPREKEVILGIVKGLSNKEIASEMNVSVNTVMTHRRNIASKLQIHSAAGLTIYAITTGLVDISDIKNSDYI